MPSRTTRKPPKRQPPTDTYWGLCQRFPLRPIADDAEHVQAMRMVDELVDLARLDSGQQDYLGALSELIEAYDRQHHAIEYTSDGSMLQFLCEPHGLIQQAVAESTGIANSTLSAVIHGKRRFTREQIRLLSKRFNCSPGVFAG